MEPQLSMTDEALRKAMDQVPVGITVIDLDRRILYYNGYCAQIVDRKPEYIGRDIKDCHQKTESIEKIDRFLEEIKNGRREKFHYEATRNGLTLAVTVSPYRTDGKLTGFIQSFVVKRLKKG